MSGRKVIFGLILVFIGVLLLGRTLNLFYWDVGDIINIAIPFGLIGLGIWLIIRKQRQHERMDRHFTGYSSTFTPPPPPPPPPPPGAAAAAALEALGPDHRFVTRLAYDPATVRTAPDGRTVLGGELVVAPGGDPTLGAEDLRRLAAGLWALGLDSLAGPQTVDPGRFDARPLGPGWMWDDGDRPWAARVSAACVDGGCLVWRGAEAAWPLPGASLLRIADEPPGGAEASLCRDWVRRRDDFRLAPALPWARRLESGPPAAPPRCAAEGPHAVGPRPAGPACNAEHPDSLFRAVWGEALASAFDVAAPPRIGRGAFARLAAAPGSVVLEHAGPPLAAILDSCLTASWNLAAECVFQELAAARDERSTRTAGTAPAVSTAMVGAATWEGAAAVLASLLDDAFELPGTPRIVDGSGMSRYNALTPRQLCDLLAASQRRRPGELAALLAVPGEGTLATMRPPAGVELRAKTGTLRGRHGLAGYLLAAGRPRYAFCLLISGQAGGSAGVACLRDEIVARLAAWCGKDAQREGNE